MSSEILLETGTTNSQEHQKLNHICQIAIPCDCLHIFFIFRQSPSFWQLISLSLRLKLLHKGDP